MPDPDIFQYLDYRALLRDWLAARAGKPSLRALAGRAGCSPALVSAVINGKRDLDAGRAELLAEAMKLDAPQTEHFVDLVALAHDRSSRRRKRAHTEALTTQRFHAAQERVTDAVLAVLSDPEIGAVFELARCAGWRNDPEWIARSLQPPTTPAVAAAAVEALKEAGMLVHDESGELTVAGPEWASGHDIPAAQAADRLHRRLLARAPNVLDVVPAAERHFGAGTFAVSSSLVAQMRARVARFHEEMMNLVETSSEPRDRVYQLNVQFYPAARPVDDDE